MEYPAHEKNGDYALTSAFALSKTEKRKAMELASEIAQNISAPIFEKVEVAPPGFVNLFLAPGFLKDRLKTTEADKVQRLDKKRGKILIEFVSSNPTGPVNVVSARAAAIGDTLVRIFNFLDDDAKSEFYVCDTGAQIETLGSSILARIKKAGEVLLSCRRMDIQVSTLSPLRLILSKKVYQRIRRQSVAMG